MGSCSLSGGSMICVWDWSSMHTDDWWGALGISTISYACMCSYFMYMRMNLTKISCWFNHHFGLLAYLPSILRCIFSRVFPFWLYAFTCFQGAHSPHPPCVRTAHEPSLNCCMCHTLATNKDILLASMKNCGQGDTIQPTIGTPRPNGLRSSWDFLPGRSREMFVGLALSTFLALEGGPDDKLCPLILFWTFAYLSWILLHSTLHDVFHMPNLSTSWGSFLISCLNSRMIVKVK